MVSTIYRNHDHDTYHRQQAEGVHPEDMPLLGGGQGRYVEDVAQDAGRMLWTAIIAFVVVITWSILG